jgi:hypothetical protein
MTHTGNTLITPAEAAKILYITPKTLAQWRVRGYGPRYLKIGHKVLLPLGRHRGVDRATGPLKHVGQVRVTR